MQNALDPTSPGALERTTRLAIPLFLLLAIVTLAFGVGFIVNDLSSDDAPASAAPITNNGQIAGDTVGAAILNEIYSILSSDYVDRELINQDNFRRAAINGILTSLNDPHTNYYTQEELASGVLDFSASYQGIGAVVSMDTSGRVTIVAPYRDSPAEAAGIRPGDAILEINGESIEGWTHNEAAAEIRGPAGTEVTILVEHTDGSTETLVIRRGEIPLQSVYTSPSYELIPGESGTDLVDRDGNVVTDLAYIQIAVFHENTPEELQEALEAVEDGDYSGLILDLRSNPGGWLQETIDIADMFLDDGVILYQEDADGARRTFAASAGGIATEIPIVIIQDQGSASGSEVLAAALRDNDRARIVGTRSNGKGTVNKTQELTGCGDPAGCGALYLSIGRWYTPNNQQIEGLGVTPDVEIELTEDAYIEEGDVQMFAAIDLLRGN